jgi:hypothetical protein
MYWLLEGKSKRYNQLWSYQSEPINRIHAEHRNTRTLSVEGSAHDKGRTMVCAEYRRISKSQGLKTK